jgi:flagellar hook-length control protein FliK
MNVNLLTIDFLAAMPAQPNPSRDVASAGGHDFGPDGNQLVLDTAKAGVNKRAGVLQPDNISQKEQIPEEKPPNEGFDTVLRRRLKTNDSQTGTGDGKITEKPLKSEASNKDGQAQPLILLQAGIASPTGQKQPIINDKPFSNQTSQPSGQTVKQTITTSVKNANATAGVDVGKNVESRVLKQTRPAVGTTQNQNLPTIAVQNEGQKHVAGQQEKLTGAMQTTEKAGVTTSRPVEIAALGKSDETANQRKPAGKTESADLETPRFTPIIKTTDVKSGSDISKEVLGKMHEQIITRAQGVTEATNQQHTKDKLIADRQKGSWQKSGDKQSVNGQAEKLGAEKADLSSVKSGMAKSESGNQTANLSHGQIATIGSNQVAEAGAAVIGRGAATIANSSVPDNTATLREQIYQSVKTSVQQGQSHITIKLNPPELGQVSVKFSEQGRELTGLLEATNPQTRADIRQAIPEIIRSLEESGVSVKRLDVILSDLPRQSSQQSLRDNGSQDLWEQFSHQGFENPAGNRPSQDSFAAPAYFKDAPVVHSDASSNRNQSSPSDKLLDVLI